MDIWIGFAVAALKAGVLGVVGDGIEQALVDQGIDLGSDQLKRYLERVKRGLGQVLTDKSLKEMDVLDDQTAYIREEIKELLRSVSLDEDLFRNCHYDAKSLAEALYKKYAEQKKDFVEYKSEIQKVLYVMSEKAISLEKERDGFTADSLVHIIETEDEQMELLRKIFYILDEFMKTRVTNTENGKEPKRKKRLPDRTEEYRRKWDENMFLNDFDEEDDNAGVNILLKELYQVPFYRLRDNKKDISELEQRLERCTNTTERKRRMLLILGQPGMGKSTLITWFAAQYQKKQDQEKKELLIYRFTDFNIDWSFSGNGKRKDIDSVILESLNMDKEDLNGKILILDGFDEVAVSNRTVVLNRLYNSWSADSHIKDFALLVTCRENYIENLSDLFFPYITLQPWDDQQIERFCRNYEKHTRSCIPEEAIEKMKNMKNVFGIPIILYMTLALEITVRDESSVVEVYDQIFSLEGGIYDRCLKKDSYIRWDDEHRIVEIKKQIHQFSREISMWMFENNPQQAEIPKEKYEKIWDEIFEQDNNINESQKKDVLIGNYFRSSHCYDGVDTEQLSFVHRSIYEFFVAETICSEIREATFEMTEKTQEKLAAVLGYRLKKGWIDYTIGQYLKTKMVASTAGYSKEQKKCFYDWLEETVGKMLDVGMLYYTGINIKEYRNVIQKEMNCFLNLLNILRLFLDFSDREYILRDIKQKQVIFYIKCMISFVNIEAGIKIDLSKAYLSGVNLRDIDLKGANLRGADLHSAKLRRANFRGANLREANLNGANLDSAYLRGANLREADLRGAHLKGVDLSEANLRDAKLGWSQWQQEDIDKYIDVIKESEFDVIISYSGTTGGTKIITRTELFE